MKYYIVLIVLFSLIFKQSLTQISIPITNKDLSDITRERETIAMMQIDLSQTWLYMVEDNIISTNRLLLSEIYYENGLPKKILFYNKNQKTEAFTIIKYNHQNLPFEEIRFNADSSLINGIMYEYDENNLLMREINYNNTANIVSVQTYNRSNDTIYVAVTNGNNELLNHKVICLETVSGVEYMKHLYKLDSVNKVIEQIAFEYNKMTDLTKKFIINESNHATMKDFVYDDNGALIKSSFYDTNSKLISSSSFEYDTYGNILRIIEKGDNDNSTKVFTINYLSKTKE